MGIYNFEELIKIRLSLLDTIGKIEEEWSDGMGNGFYDNYGVEDGSAEWQNTPTLLKNLRQILKMLDDSLLVSSSTEKS